MNSLRRNTQTGFTIVELLIVIVVIGILATITIVAYNNIQNKAHDTAVKSDLSNFVKKVSLYSAEDGTFPPGGSYYGNISGAPAPGFSVKISKSSYDTTIHNLSYCIGTISGETIWAVSAKSKSGTVFRYRSNQGLANLGEISHSTSTACSGMEAGYSYSYGYYSTTNQWWPWTQ